MLGPANATTTRHASQIASAVHRFIRQSLDAAFRPQTPNDEEAPITPLKASECHRVADLSTTPCSRRHRGRWQPENPTDAAARTDDVPRRRSLRTAARPVPDAGERPVHDDRIRPLARYCSADLLCS